MLPRLEAVCWVVVASLRNGVDVTSRLGVEHIHLTRTGAYFSQLSQTSVSNLAHHIGVTYHRGIMLNPYIIPILYCFIGLTYLRIDAVDPCG